MEIRTAPRYRGFMLGGRNSFIGKLAAPGTPVAVSPSMPGQVASHVLDATNGIATGRGNSQGINTRLLVIPATLSGNHIMEHERAEMPSSCM